jgi:hypothetical protein
MLMMRRNPVLACLVLLALLFSGYYLFSQYLVSKLDGTGGVTAPAVEENWRQYASEDGVSFSYPDTYELSSRTSSNGGDTWDVLLLLPKGYVPPQNGEGPPAIIVSVFPASSDTSLETWVRTDNRSGYELSQDGYLTKTAVGGQPALVYRHSGLYETDAVAVLVGGKVFLFSAGWLEQGDQIRADFQKMLTTVQFY